MRKKTTSSLRGSVELALTEVEGLLKAATAHNLPAEVVEKVKIGIFEPLQRAHTKLQKLVAARKAPKKGSTESE